MFEGLPLTGAEDLVASTISASESSSESSSDESLSFGSAFLAVVEGFSSSESLLEESEESSFFAADLSAGFLDDIDGFLSSSLESSDEESSSAGLAAFFGFPSSLSLESEDESSAGFLAAAFFAAFFAGALADFSFSLSLSEDEVLGFATGFLEAEADIEAFFSSSLSLSLLSEESAARFASLICAAFGFSSSLSSACLG